MSARAEVEQALGELKRVSENGTVAEIKPAIDALQQASYKMAELLYKASAPQGEQSADGSGGSNGASAGAAEDVIDAEFKDVQQQAPFETEAGEAVVEETSTTAEASLEESLAAANARADENFSKYLLAVADYDNYRKRVQRDLDGMVASRRRMLLERFLPVLDNLERALESNAEGDKLRGGIEQTLRGFEAVLGGEGVKSIEVKGKPFDPRVAEAIETTDAADVPEDTVVEVSEKGYSLGDELLRPAKVIVAKRAGG